MEEVEVGKKNPPSQSDLCFNAVTTRSSQPPPFLSFRKYFSPLRRFPLTCLFDRNRSVHVAARKPTWVSLQGRLVGVDEATSLRSVSSGGLGWEETLGWEMFTPMQRVLLVAVIAVGSASAESRKSREVEHLQRSIKIRDELLLCMQQKLDDLCERVYQKPTTDEDFDCCFDDFHSFGISTKTALASFDMNLSDGKKNVFENEYSRNEKLKTLQSTNITEQEERRMSDLSDFLSSATSSVDIQLSALAEQQQYYNLRQECEEKDVTIKDLKATILESNVKESKWIVELEDVIKRKNLVIAKLKKDLIFLEQQVVHLTRLRRTSSITDTSPNPNIHKPQLPVMSDNILYDMSSSSSSPSSDSDCPEVSNNYRSSFPLSGAVHQSHSQLLLKKKKSNISDTSPESCIAWKANERRRFSDIPKRRSKGRHAQPLQRRWV